MRLKVLNDTHYESFAGMLVDTAFKYKSNEWHCETADGFMVVRATAAVISMSFSEMELYKFDNMCIVGGVTDKKDEIIMSPLYADWYNPLNKKTISFIEIAKFMKWQIDEEQIWDG